MTASGTAQFITLTPPLISFLSILQFFSNIYNCKLSCDFVVVFFKSVCTFFPACIWWYRYISKTSKIDVWESSPSTLYSAIGSILIRCPQSDVRIPTRWPMSVLVLSLLSWRVTEELCGTLHLACNQVPNVIRYIMADACTRRTIWPTG